MERFAYFMVRVRRPSPGDAGDGLTGVVERLASGEKRTFDDAAELLRLVSAWPAVPPKMRPSDGGGNA